MSVEGLTQTEVAKRLGSTQGAVSQFEQREDTLLSSLGAYVQAIGGELELVPKTRPKFPIRDVAA
jgi:predicted transcriptional regulator